MTLSIFDANGNLPTGVHEWTLERVFEVFVDEFPDSPTRKQISMGFSRFLLEVIDIYGNFRIWIDGSFTTTKEGPDDIDTVTIIHEGQYMRLSKDSQKRTLGLFVGPQTKKKYLVDSYCIVEYDADHPLHNTYLSEYKVWNTQFTYDSRTGLHKGFISISVSTEDIPFLQERLAAEGGEG